ncbi:MAG: Rrf2 family transcriptional regulator [Treponema sp.]|nr:Rrf2 family transcriptional regulator [Treponema sp.]
MLKISTRGQYALLIMTTLAEQPENTYVPLKLLSHRQNLSNKYLEQILIQLSKKGLVTGARGINGGYKLNRKPEQYSVGEILRCSEGELSSHGVHKGNTITNVGNQAFWQDFDKLINDYVDNTTLDILVEKNKADPGFEYCI